VGKLEKKQLKIISIVIAVLVAAGIAFAFNSKLFSGKANIGYVDVQVIMAKHPDAQAAQETMKAEAEKAENEYNAKAATMNDQEKQTYLAQVQQQLRAKQRALITPIHDQVMTAIKEVADAKELGVVVDKNLTAQGGQDITDEVVKKITAGQQ